MSLIVFYSSETGNTEALVNKLGMRAERIPISPKDGQLEVTEPYVLITPTYASFDGRGAQPKQVSRFLEAHNHSSLLRGVIGGGNTNFGDTYCLAARDVAETMAVPLLYRFELRGTEQDVEKIKAGLEKFWKSLL